MVVFRNILEICIIIVRDKYFIGQLIRIFGIEHSRVHFNLVYFGKLTCSQVRSIPSFILWIHFNLKIRLLLTLIWLSSWSMNNHTRLNNIMWMFLINFILLITMYYIFIIWVWVISMFWITLLTIKLCNSFVFKFITHLIRIAVAFMFFIFT